MHPASTTDTAIHISGHRRNYSRNMVLLVVMSALSLILLQVSTVVVTLGILHQSLNATETQLQWLLAGYALTVGLLLVPMGRLGDVYGRSRLFVVGLALFSISSALIALAQDMNSMNLLRLLQGAGAGICSPQITGLIQQYFSGQLRAKAYALMGFIISVSFAAGPLLAGMCIDGLGDNLGWRITFLLNLPLGMLAVWLALRCLPFSRERRRAAAHVPLHPDFDLLGMALLTLSVVTLMLPFISHHPQRMLLLPIAFISLLLWLFWEWRYQERGKQPMVNLNLFRLPSFSFGVLLTSIVFLAQSSIFALLAIFLQQGFGSKALDVGLISLPAALCSCISAIASGRFTLKHGHSLMPLALLLMIAGLLGAAWMSHAFVAGISPWWLCAPFAILGLGQGIFGSANQTQSMMDVPAAHGGAAGGIQQTAQRIMTGIGNAMFTAIFFHIANQVGSSAELGRALAASYSVAVLVLLVALFFSLMYWRVRQKQLRQINAPLSSAI